MEPHFYNPIPSDYNSDKVKFWPFDYDFDNNQPKRFEEKKWVETDKYINSKEGNNILDKGNVDKLQTFYDHLFVQMDDRMEHTEMKPPYEYEKSMRKGELLASHVYIYDKSGDELQLRPFSNLSLINTTVTNFKIASENYIYFENATIENIIASEHSENGLQNSEIILENCSSLKEIKELKWCKIRIRNSDISNLQIKDNQDCEFFIESGSASAKSEFLKNNTGCLFDFKSVTSSNQYLSKGNQNCMIRFDGVTMSNTEAFNGNDTLRGEMIDSTAQGCTWFHNGDKKCDYWYEGHSSSGITQGCSLENSKQFFNDSTNNFTEKMHTGSGLHVSYDKSTISGNQKILELEKSYAFMNDSEVTGSGGANFGLKSCEMVSFGGNFTVSGADNFDTQDSYIDLVKTQVQASGGKNLKSTNSFFNLRKSSKLNTDDKNTEMTNGGLSTQDSQVQASANNFSGSELRNLDFLRTQVEKSADNFSIQKVDRSYIYESEFNASGGTGSITDLGETYHARNAFSSPGNFELTGSEINYSRFYDNAIEEDTLSFEQFNTMKHHHSSFTMQTEVSFTDIKDFLGTDNQTEMLCKMDNVIGKSINYTVNSDNFEITDSNIYEKNFSTDMELIVDDSIYKMDKSSVSKKATLSGCLLELNQNSISKNVNITDCEGKIDTNTFSKSFELANSILDIRKNTISQDYITTDSIIRSYKNTSSASVSMDGEQLSLSDTASSSFEFNGITSSKNNSGSTVSFIGCTKSLEDSGTIDLTGTGEVNASGSQITTEGNFHITDISSATATGILTTNASTVSSITGAGVATDGNDPGINGIQMTNLGGTSEVKSSLFHYDKSSVFHHTKAPIIDHN